MALPTSGTITASMINTEIGRASNAPFSLNDPDVRTLAGKPTGAISFSDFYGKAWLPQVLFTPASYSPMSGLYLFMFLNGNRNCEVVDEDNGASDTGTWLSRAINVGETVSVTVKNVGPDYGNITIRKNGVVQTTIAVGSSYTFTMTSTTAIEFEWTVSMTGKTAGVQLTIGASTKTCYIYA